jgi:hypothetical protein
VTFARAIFLIAMCFGLAAAPVRAIASCTIVSAAPSCQSCCANPDAACCSDAGDSKAPALPATNTSASGDAKLLAAPVVHLLSVVPAPAVEPSSIHRQHLARIPAQPLIFKTCIRLI